MTSHTTLSTLGALSAALILGSCTAGDARPASEGPAAEPVPGVAAESPPSLEGPGPWTTTSSAGNAVTLSVAEVPLRAGPVHVNVRVDGAGAAVMPWSIDLMSPEMIMHGLVRIPVNATHDSTFTAMLDIPMEGLWALYVNLDEIGEDTAEFRFDVVPGSGGGHPHGGSASPEPGSNEHG